MEETVYLIVATLSPEAADAAGEWHEVIDGVDIDVMNAQHAAMAEDEDYVSVSLWRMDDNLVRIDQLPEF